MSRQERTGIEFPDATWTSSDRYDRYGAVARCLRASLGDGRHRVLDVGDAAGYLQLFAGDLELYGVDIYVQPDRLGGTVPMVADGTRLPFADDTFDAVVTSDVLEHVPADARPSFLAELARVSRDLVIVAAPFDTAGVAGVEEVIRRYVPIATGEPQDQLDEHMERGLPDLAATVTAFETRGMQVVVSGNGNLWDWLELMLVKHQLLARPALQPFHDGIDVLCNLSLAGRAMEPPFYRHLVVSRRDRAPELGAAPAPPMSPERASSMLSSLMVAAGPESTRQDVVPPLDGLVASVSGLATRAELEALRASLDARLDAIASELVVVRQQGDRISSVLDRVRRPFRRAGAIGQDSADG